MAIVLDAFMTRCITLLTSFVDGEACGILGVRDDIRKLLKTMVDITSNLESSDSGRMRAEDPVINSWVVQLKDAIYEVDDIIDRLLIEGRRLVDARRSSSTVVRRSFSLFKCFSCTKFRHEIGIEIVNLNDRLKELDEARFELPDLMHTDPSVEEIRLNHCQTGTVEARNEAVGAQIVKAEHSLVQLIARGGKKKVEVFGVVGMDGIGKTTLARKIYNDEKIIDNFPIRVWISMSKKLSEIDLLKEIITSAGGNCGEAEGSKAELVNCLTSTLVRSFFIVLDDVCKSDVWGDLLRDSLINIVARGRILITTRDINITKKIKANIHHVDSMDADSGWALLCKEVFADCEEDKMSSLKEVGIKIVKKCNGHPLAIKAIAGVLRSREKRRIEWKKVLEHESWSMRQFHELPVALYLSYDDLHSNLKQCFLYSALYPEDYQMNCFDLARYWIAEGFIPVQTDALPEDLAEEYHKELIRRNLLELDQSSQGQTLCKMHDLMRSFAQFLVADESILIDGGQRFNMSPLPKPRRVAICNAEASSEVAISVKQQRSLRALLFFSSPNMKIIENVLLLQTVPLLRVLELSNTSIETLPSSIGDLIHLRYLNLDRTNIRELPPLIGCLVNLQTLSLEDCQYLHKLPKSIALLGELRCLRLARTSLSYVPKGVGKMKHLNHLAGFTVGHDFNPVEYSEGCDLDELQSLSELRYLHVENLERANSGALALRNKPLLRELYLCGRTSLKEEQEQEQEKEEGEEEKEEGQGQQQQQQEPHHCTEEEILRCEKIWNELSPPPTIQRLVIQCYSGRWFPNWMTTSKLGNVFTDLVYLELCNCSSCMQLPPLGLLPQLKHLHISNADAVTAIGTEFLGDHRASSATTTAFPKLEVLVVKHMNNLEEWSLGTEEEVDPKTEGPKLVLPCLRSLDIQLCPKLRSLPQGLRHTSTLHSLHIEGADGLTEIGDLPFLTDELYLKNNKKLQRVSKLPSLRSLVIDDAPSLKYVDSLDALENLSLIYPPSTETFFFDELIIFWSIDFPRWLPALLKKHYVGPNATHNLHRFDVRCTLPLLKSCMEGGKNWHIVKQIPEVRITSSDGSAYLRYSKSRCVYLTNVGSGD
ncbi:putative disease resistance protein RGA3 [Typha latifolia]|uniref:putative disease resistance protein RGA3 n=1 Tax=Typha latifolia TaxID=4733 RepID=UPI003C2E0A5B